jgi:hypothetical protein
MMMMMMMLVMMMLVACGVVPPMASSSSSSSSEMDIAIDGSTVTFETIQAAQRLVDTILLEKNCHPIMIRLAWHVSGTYDQEANAGLIHAIDLLEPVKAAFPTMSYADLFQMASARAVELAGGPKIDMRYVWGVCIYIYIYIYESVCVSSGVEWSELVYVCGVE